MAQTQTGDESQDYQYALIEAVKQKNLGNFPEAVKLYKLVIDERDDVAVAHYELGTIYLLTGKPETAETYLKKAYELDPGNNWYRGGYLDVLVVNQRYRDAEKILKKHLKSDPEDVEHAFQLATLYSMAGKMKKSLGLLDKIEEENGYSEKVTLLKASIYEEMGKYRLAKIEVERVLEYFPESVQFRIVAAELALKSGNEDEAAKYYGQVIEIDSTNVYALTNLTDYYRKREDYSRSFYYLTRTFQDSRIERERKLAILSYYVSEEKFTNNYRYDLENLVKVYLENYPDDVDGKLVATEFYIGAKDYEKAYFILKEYLSGQSAPYGVWMQGILLANAAGLNEELVDITERVMNNYNDSADIIFFRALGLFGMERYEEAAGILEEIEFENYSNKEYARTSTSLLAEAYNRMKVYDKSDMLYEQIIKENPADYIAMNNYSYYLAEREEKLEYAKSLSYVTIRDNPDNATFLDTYAWILYKLGDYSNADRYIREALNKGGDTDPDINEHAGDILVALGSKELAKKYYEKAIILGGDKERLSEKIMNIENE